MKRNLCSMLLCSSLLAAATGLILFPQDVSGAVSYGMRLCADTLLPNLFPFMVLSGVFVRSGLAERLGEKADSLMRNLFQLPGVCFSAWLFGMIGGYPTGAKTVVSLYRSGSCSKDEAEHTLAFCNNCGPGFLISGIGFGMFQNTMCGIVLYAIHIVAAFLTGVTLAPSSRITHHKTGSNPGRAASFPVCFVTSVSDAMSAFLNLCAFVLCFSAILVLVERSGVAALLASVLPFAKENATGFLLGCIEMTCGIFHLTKGNFTECFIIITALAAWGGLSVHCQTISLLQGTDLSPVLYLKGKVIHALIAILLAMCVSFGIPLSYSAVVGTILAGLLRRSKKAVEMRAKVYYNGGRKNKGVVKHEPVPEKN